MRLLEGDGLQDCRKGQMDFKIANIREDYHILVEANKDAKEFLKKDLTSLH